LKKVFSAMKGKDTIFAKQAQKLQEIIGTGVPSQ